jgi:hypothetical protein
MRAPMGVTFKENLTDYSIHVFSLAIHIYSAGQCICNFYEIPVAKRTGSDLRMVRFIPFRFFTITFIPPVCV